MHIWTMWRNLLAQLPSATSDFYYTIPWSTESTTNLAETIKIDAIQWTVENQSIMSRLLELFQFSTASWYPNTGNAPAIAYIKWIVNMGLGLVSLISLILVIYGFYLMFFSKEEEGFSKAKKILKGVAIALAIMGLSWFIVSFFFSVQQQTVPV